MDDHRFYIELVADPAHERGLARGRIQHERPHSVLGECSVMRNNSVTATFR